MERANIFVDFAGCNERLDARRNDGQEAEGQSREEDHETVVVSDANTVVEPGAVVVEAFDAPIADGAVAGAGRPQDETIWTHLTWVYLCQQFHEVVVGAEVAWIANRSYEEAQDNKWAQSSDYIC